MILLTTITVSTKLSTAPFVGVIFWRKCDNYIQLTTINYLYMFKQGALKMLCLAPDCGHESYLPR